MADLPVEVAGVYSAGLDMGPLEDLGCAAQATWVEIPWIFLGSRYGNESSSYGPVVCGPNMC